MSKVIIDIDSIKQALQNIGYIINECIERENNGTNWQIKFTNSDAIATIYDTNTKRNTVVNGKPEDGEKEMLKWIIDSLKRKEFCIDPLNKEIVALINSRKEDYFYDFKQCMSGNTGDLLHDILCLLNNTENRDAYLIIGVTDSYEVIGVDENCKSNNLFDFLKTIKFAGNHMPNIEFKQLYYKYHKIAVIVCKSSTDVPYYILEEHKGVHPNQIYTRLGDTNTPKNRHADYPAVEKLWRIHFSQENK